MCECMSVRERCADGDVWVGVCACVFLCGGILFGACVVLSMYVRAYAWRTCVCKFQSLVCKTLSLLFT